MHTNTVRAAILGSDLILAALPAEPVQVVHACMALGFDLVVPASWGDELLASGVLDELAQRPAGTAIMCTCPHARKRLLSAGSELLPYLVEFVPPPVAAARYLANAHTGSDVHITYFGACPGAVDDSIAQRHTPATFLEMCAARGVSVIDQPNVFESRMPADRRRHFSIPGGLPTTESVHEVNPDMDIISLESATLALDVAQCVMTGKTALLDSAPAVGCACSGFVGDSAWNDGREVLRTLEPPRSATPIVDIRVQVDIEAPAARPAYPAFEESVPLDVVVGADLNGFTHDYLDAAPAIADERAPDTHVAGHEFGDDPFDWSESSPLLEPSQFDAIETPVVADLPPVQGTPHESSEHESSGHESPSLIPPALPLTANRHAGTPTGAPAIRTAEGLLPRAYLMLRRLRGGSGSHATVRPGEGREDREGREDHEDHEDREDREDRESREAGEKSAADTAGESDAATPAGGDTGAHTHTAHNAANDAGAPAPSAQNAVSEDTTRPTPAAGVDRRSSASGVEGMLDAISRVIRDAVEPR